MFLEREMEEPSLRYEILKKIGEGTFGKVFLGREKETSRKIALKKVKIRNNENGLSINLIREISILRSLSHRNVIRITEAFINNRRKVHAFERESYTICMVFPYVRTDLSRLIKKSKISVTDAALYTKQILQGLAYIHSRHIIHRDIKPSNILVCSNKTVKIADFGLARVYSDRDMSCGVVTRSYRAPELLLGSAGYSDSIDVWSVGCTVGEMLQGKILFTRKSEIEVLVDISHLCGEIRAEVFRECRISGNMGQTVFGEGLMPKISETFGKYSKVLSSLMEQMLVIDPRKRITAKKALSYLK